MIMTKSIVIVSTSAAILNGHKTGVWIEELATPFYAFKEAGLEVILASTKGGPVPIDAASLSGGGFTEAAKKFMHDKEGIGSLSHSVPIGEIDWSSIDALFLPGGHGTCVDFVDTPALKGAIEKMYADDKIVAAVCHGPLALCNCNKPDGTPLVAGKVVTGFADSEEVAANLEHLVPFMLESKLRELGGLYEKTDNFKSKAVADGKLVTGQNPQSSDEVAKLVLELLA